VNSTWPYVAELPELFGGPGVLEHDTVDLERVQLAVAVAVDRVGDVLEEDAEQIASW